MTKRMLIDSTHAEETRVVVLDGNRLEDFDVETSTKKQLKGNIYLAKIVRVEPSLQAAFVEYGGGRHGFLAFGEIHPDYYQIPVADRQRLLKMQAEEAREAELEDDEPAALPGAGADEPEMAESGEDAPMQSDETGSELPMQVVAEAVPPREHREIEAEIGEAEPPAEPAPSPEAPEADSDSGSADSGMSATADEPAMHQPGADETGADETGQASEEAAAEHSDEPTADHPDHEVSLFDAPAVEQVPPDSLGGEGDVFEGNGAEEARARRSARFLRNYRIQEVIRRRQILLIQVVKEERGTKGAALTTYISLAGRFCVLMPNSPRGGGISRKITSAADRRRLKEITAELEVPDGMGLIVRTAGAARPKPEIRRDCEYLMRLWDDIRDHTMRSMAPALIYEEASLIKRTIRDVYSRDVDEVLVDGEDGWRAAHDFMRMLMPGHAKKVQLWRGTGGPLFSSNGVEAQLDAMLTPNVQLKSGGYLVINQTEALVAIDVNSGRATRERGIEETALKTNLEAADEVARQLRLRDLAGLIVIDFIDMDAKKHNMMVERRMKEALKNDRARIQVGQISHFGLMEMSRQRLRSSLAETSFVTCPHCVGLGLVRSTESAAIHVLRAIEDEGGKGKAALIMLHVASPVMMYILNNKRDRLAEIEARTAMRVQFAADDSLLPPEVRIDRLKPQIPEAERALPAPVAPAAPPMAMDDSDEEEDDFVGVPDDDAAATGVRSAATPRREPVAAAVEGEDGDQRRRRRRRRRGGRRDGVEGAPGSEPVSAIEGAAEDQAEGAEGDDEAEPGIVATDAVEPDADGGETPPVELDENGMPKARRRGRRGGRRRRKDAPGEGGETAAAADGENSDAPADAPMPYQGPTPADPFGRGFDFFDLMDEQEERATPKPAVPPPAEPVVEDLADPVVEHLAEPVVEHLAEPVVEHQTEPVAGHVEPVEQSAAEPEVAQIVETPHSEPASEPEPVGAAPQQDAVETPAAPAKRGWWSRK